MLENQRKQWKIDQNRWKNNEKARRPPRTKKSKEYAYILFAPIWKTWVSEEWERKLAIGYEQIQI